MIGLLEPAGLIALAALALPLLIHLLRRPEQRVVSFAAWRHLNRRAMPRDHLQLRERLLLALRLLLIGVIALLLALPVWRGRADDAAWVIVAPEVDAAAARAAIDAPSAQWHRLAPGFPALDAAPMAVTAGFSSLLRQLDAELPASAPLTVVVPEELAGLDAERLRLSREVQWKIVHGATAKPEAAQPLRLSVRSRANNQGELPTVQALAQAWKAKGIAIELDVADQDRRVPNDTDVLVWLGGAPSAQVLRWIAHGGTALLADAPAPAAANRANELGLTTKPSGRGRIVSVTGPLDAQKNPALQAADVPERLRALLLPAPKIPDRAYASAVTPSAGADAGVAPGRPLDEILIALAALLFAAERFWAARTQRR